MTNIQLYLSIGIPAFIVAFGMLFNGLLFQSVSARMVSLEQSLSARMSSLEQSFNSRITSLEEKIFIYSKVLFTNWINV